MDKCVQMLDKELWRLGPDGPGDGKKLERGARPRMEKKKPWIEKAREESPGSKGLEESAKEKGLVQDWSEKDGKMMNTGGVENRI
ncbi:hypothetical protein TNCV_4068381 [Trichonephila clavipes]|nr:hypothetical protein TNCV_4068381 [Trichonephila clavipes]